MIKDCAFCFLGTMYALEKDALIFDVDNDLITVVRPDVVPVQFVSPFDCV